MATPTPTRSPLDPGSRSGPLALASAVGALAALGMLVFWPWALDQFTLPKTLVLLAAGSVLAALAVTSPDPAEVPAAGRGPLVPLAAATILWLVAAPFPRAPNTTLHLAGSLFFLAWAGGAVAAAVSRRRGGPRAMLRILAGLGGGGGAVAVFAVLQGMGLDPVRLLLGLEPIGPGRWRILTSIGNPGWTAETLAVTAPAAVTLALETGPHRTRLGSAAAVVLLFSGAVAWTGSRTGAVGLAVGLAVLVVLRRSRPGAGRWSAVVGAGALALVLGLSAALGAWRWSELRPLTGRLGLWWAGATLVLDRPLDGWGLLHTQRELPAGLERVVRCSPPEFRSLLPRLVVDRLDDDWLQFALEGGIPAALLAALLLVSAAVLSWRRARRSADPGEGAVAASLVVLGLLALVSAPLHTPATAAVFWILVGTVAGGGTGPAAAGGHRPRPLRYMAWALVPAAMVLAWTILAADVEAGRGLRAARRGRSAEAVRLLRWAAPRVPWLAPAWSTLARVELETGHPERALEVVRRARKWTASAHLWAVEVRALEAQGRPEAARRVLTAALAVLPASPVLLELETAGEGGTSEHPGPYRPDPGGSPGETVPHLEEAPQCPAAASSGSRTRETSAPARGPWSGS